MSSSSSYWTTTEGETVIGVIVAVGVVVLVAIIAGIIGYWCYTRGKFSKQPALYAKRPVWALPQPIPPRRVLPGEEPPAQLDKPKGTEKIAESKSEKNTIGSDGIGGIHIHHHEGGEKTTEELPIAGEPVVKPGTKKVKFPVEKAAAAYNERPPTPSVEMPTVSDNLTMMNQPTTPSFLPHMASGAEHIKPFMPMSMDPHLSAPVDNILTNHLLRFVTGSTNRVPRNTNLKSVLVLNKQRRKTLQDDDFEKAEEEEDELANNFVAIGGDSIEVDADGGNVFVDEDDKIHVYAHNTSKVLHSQKEVL